VIPSRIAAILLGIALLLMAGAWQLQSRAGADLEAAQEAQSRETQESDSEPPDPDDYRAILATLEHSIVIRRDIEEQLQAIESSIASLESRQAEAAVTASTARDALLAIARALGGAADASNASLGSVDTLKDRLGVSAELARLIAEELEELDHKLGPTAGGRP
jgi:hypothetical protein